MPDGLFSGWHILIVLLLLVVLFGSKKLPEGARALGQSMRIFRSEVRQGQAEAAAAPAIDPTVTPPAAAPAPTAPPATPTEPPAAG
jgi:sec-independent protein translocase protein TatA